MADSRLTIFPCPHPTTVCENYLCRQSIPSKKKYFIGNQAGAAHKPVFCEDCVRYLVSHIPADLIEGGADLEAGLRETIQAEFDLKLRQAIEAMRIQLHDEISLQLAVKFAKEQQENELELAKTIKEFTVTDDENQEVLHIDEEGNLTATGDIVSDDDDDDEFRCLDCDYVTDSKQKLSAHRRSHRKPKA